MLGLWGEGHIKVGVEVMWKRKRNNNNNKQKKKREEKEDFIFVIPGQVAYEKS